MLSGITAVVAVTLLVMNAGFQLALAAGARWGHAAYGGRVALGDGSLPMGYRLASLLAVLVMGFLAWVAMVSAGLLDTGLISEHVATWTCTGAAVLFALNTMGNLASSSRVERRAMAPATAILAVAFGLLGWVA